MYIYIAPPRRCETHNFKQGRVNLLTELWFGLYTIFPLPIWYGVWHAKGMGSG